MSASNKGSQFFQENYTTCNSGAVKSSWDPPPEACQHEALKPNSTIFVEKFFPQRHKAYCTVCQKEWESDLLGRPLAAWLAQWSRLTL